MVGLKKPEPTSISFLRMNDTNGSDNSDVTMINDDVRVDSGRRMGAIFLLQ